MDDGHDGFGNWHRFTRRRCAAPWLPRVGRRVLKLHLDTDLGGDPDDACALVMMLGWPDVEILGISTNLDRDGRRAGMVYELFRRAGRTGIPLAAGVGASATTMSVYDPQSDDGKYWGRAIRPRPGAPGAALDLLHTSITRGATIVAIGALTNLALLEIARPGALNGVRVVVMGGWIDPPGPGLPAWGPEHDWNVQCDAQAALIACRSADVTLVPLPVAMRAHLRARDLPRLRRSGPLGDLLAAQSVLHAEQRGFAELVRSHPALPGDLVNFHWDPVAAAVALGWSGAKMATRAIRVELEAGRLRFHVDRAGRPMNVLVELDAEAFGEAWLAAVERAQSRARSGLGDPGTP